VQAGATPDPRQAEGVPGLHHVVAQGLANAAIAHEVVSAFGSDGIPSVLLKGASFEAWLYPGTPRASVDVDLLVPPSRLVDAETILAARGFTHAPLDDLLGDKPWHAHEWIRRRDGAIVDLHRTLLGLRAPADEVWEALAARAETLPLVGRRNLLALDEAARCLHVALHAAQGGSSTSKALRDLTRALAVAPNEAWAEAAVIAERLRGTEAYAAGLRLDDSGGAVIADRLGLPDRFAAEVELRRRNAAPEAVGLAWFLSLPTWAARRRWLRSKLLPPREFMLAWDARAEGGHVALASAYVRRWGWILSRLPGAVRLWLRANRARSQDRS
jgi:hypothetical protein